MSLAITQELIKEAVTQRPDYRAVADQTREGLACYFEGEALRRQIVQYPKEDQEKFAWRRERMLDSFDNFVKEISESYLEGTFRTKLPIRKTGNPKLDRYLMEDFAEWFLQDFAPFALFLPELYVVCDMPAPLGEISSKADQEELQGLPFPALFFPQYCCNMGFNPDNTLAWCSFYYDEAPALTPKDRTNDSPIAGATSTQKEQWYKMYTDSYWAIFNQNGQFMPNADGSPGGPYPHDFGFLPVVRVAWRANLSAQDSMRAGYAFMHSIVKITLGGLTAKGVLHDFQFYSLFPKLVTDESTADSIVETGLSANALITVPPMRDSGAGGIKEGMKPFYLEVPLREFEALERISYERIPVAAYRAARLRDRTTMRSSRGVAQSGISKMFDMVPELGVLKSISKFLRRSDLAICQMLALLCDLDPKKVDIEYPATFDTKSVSEIMAETQQMGTSMKASNLPSSDRGSEIISQRIYRAILPDLPQAEYDRIDKEIAQALLEQAVPLGETDETLSEGEPSEPLPIGEAPTFPTSGKG